MEKSKESKESKENTPSDTTTNEIKMKGDSNKGISVKEKTLLKNDIPDSYSLLLDIVSNSREIKEPMKGDSSKGGSTKEKTPLKNKEMKTSNSSQTSEILEMIQRIPILKNYNIPDSYNLLLDIILSSGHFPKLVEQYRQDENTRNLQRHKQEGEILSLIKAEKLNGQNNRSEVCIVCGDTNAKEYFSGYDIYTCCIYESECYQRLRTMMSNFPLRTECEC